MTLVQLGWLRVRNVAEPLGNTALGVDVMTQCVGVSVVRAWA